MSAANSPFSAQLKSWVNGSGKKSLGGLIEAFGENAFFTVFALCMALPALPIPTGGITHVLEVVVILLALEVLIGRTTIWLPQTFAKHELPEVVTRKALPKFIQYLEWLERHSRPRGKKLFAIALTPRIVSLLVILFAAGALLAIPFSGLDTVVSIGAVVLSLGMVLKDMLYVAIGTLIGGIGLVVQITLGALVAKGIKNLWNTISPTTRWELVAGVFILVAALYIFHRARSSKSAK